METTLLQYPKPISPTLVWVHNFSLMHFWTLTYQTRITGIPRISYKKLREYTESLALKRFHRNSVVIWRHYFTDGVGGASVLMVMD